MAVLECPICSHAMGEGEGCEGACPACGFPYPYVRRFGSAGAHRRWCELVASHRADRVSQARTRIFGARLLQASHTDVYLLDDRTHVLSRGTMVGFSVLKEGVARFSAAGRDLVAVMTDGSLWALSGTWVGTPGTKYRDVELASGCLYALRVDGTVEVQGRCAFAGEVEGWRGVEELAAGEYHVAARLGDGSVRFAASPTWALEIFRQPCSWQGIVSLSSSADCTVGLDAQGRVYVAALEGDCRCAAQEWEGVVGVAAEGSWIVGMGDDGSVLLVDGAPAAIGRGRPTAKSWEDVVALTCASASIVGIAADGSLKVAGAMPHSGLTVSLWDAAAVRRTLLSAS